MICVGGITLQYMKDTHLTLRLSQELARALARRALARGLPKSQVAREAVAHYLGATPTEAARRPVTARELAVRWVSLPRLAPDEAAGLAEDIAASRAMLPAPHAPWE